MTQTTERRELATTIDMLCGYPKDECFALIVKDDGFAPDILPNDIVIIHKQAAVENGELAAVMISGGTNAILRRVHIADSGMTLTADNSKFEPMTFNADKCDDIRIYGKVISLQRDVLMAQANDWYGYGRREE